MPFQYVLGDLLAKNPRALGALFLDPAGEAIELVSTGLSSYELRVLGAYLGIHLRQVERILGSSWLGVARALSIELENMHVQASPLPDGYYLVVVERSPVQFAASRREIERAGELLRRELFA